MRISLMLPVTAVVSLLLAGCAATPENADLLQVCNCIHLTTCLHST
jgi:hypothetical protein